MRAYPQPSMPKFLQAQRQDPGCTSCGKTKLMLVFENGGGMCRECLAYFRDDEAADRETADIRALNPKTKWKRRT